jgi:hypothetical protein
MSSRLNSVLESDLFAQHRIVFFLATVIQMWDMPTSEIVKLYHYRAALNTAWPAGCLLIPGATPLEHTFPRGFAA